MITDFSSYEEIQLRRLNRNFQVTRRGSKMLAILPLKSNQNKQGNVVSKRFQQVLMLNATQGKVSAYFYTQAQWKRLHWNRWRDIKQDELALEAGSFFEMMKILKDVLVLQ